MSELRLHETVHPTKEGMKDYDALLGIDDIKDALVDELTLILDRDRLAAWSKKHHPNGLGIVAGARSKAPLILLSGDVGCGKTALASCVASAVGRRKSSMHRICLPPETPRRAFGSGLGGGAFHKRHRGLYAGKARRDPDRSAPAFLRDRSEADDLATRRGQMQAHHEDRAGLNVLIKQIDQLSKAKTLTMAVIMHHPTGKMSSTPPWFAGPHCVCDFHRPRTTMPALPCFGAFWRAPTHPTANCGSW